MNKLIFNSLCIIAIANALTIAYGSPRFGMAAVSDLELNKIYITGGSYVAPLLYPDPFPATPSFPEVQNAVEGSTKLLEIFDPITLTFSGPNPEMAEERTYHTASYFNGSIYVFGGAGVNNDIEVYNIANNSWSIFPASFHRPKGRWGHTAVVARNQNGEPTLYIFGGIGVDCQPKNDLWALGLESQDWTELTPALSPPARGGHIMNLISYNGSTPALQIAFGTDYNANYFNDMWVLPLTGVAQWLDISLSHSAPKAEARAFPATGVWGGRMIVFGGVTQGDPNKVPDFFYLNDLWILDDDNMYEVALTGTEIPSGRAASGSALFTQEGLFFVFSGRNHQRHPIGDIWIATVEQGTWTHICYPDYEFPLCFSTCETDGTCGEGTCIDPFGMECVCDEGWQSIFGNCDFNACEGYRGFHIWELNEILLPGSIVCIYKRLNKINHQLKEIRAALPPIGKSDCVDLKSLALKTVAYYNTCLAEVCDFTEGLEDLLGCEVPCGSETKCIIGDTCINGQCVGGYTKNCSQEYGTNQCVDHSCDEQAGCVHRARDCNDFNACTNDWCDVNHGCRHDPLPEINDDNCCTLDSCDAYGNVYHVPKCWDHDPCTIDSCNTNCSWGLCEHEFRDNCYGSDYGCVTPPAPGLPRILGPSQPIEQRCVYDGSDRRLNAWYWLLPDECTMEFRVSAFDGWTHFRTWYPPAGIPTSGNLTACVTIKRTTTDYSNENSGCFAGGIVASLADVNLETNQQWNFCQNGLTRDDLLLNANGFNYFIDLNFDVDPFMAGGDGAPLQGLITFSQTRDPSCQPL